MRMISAKTSNRCQFILPKSTFCARASLDRLAATRRIITPYVIESRLMAMIGPTAPMVSSCVATVQAITQMNKAPVMPTTIDCIYLRKEAFLLLVSIKTVTGDRVMIKEVASKKMLTPPARSIVNARMVTTSEAKAKSLPKLVGEYSVGIDSCLQT